MSEAFITIFLFGAWIGLLLGLGIGLGCGYCIGKSRKGQQ